MKTPDWRELRCTEHVYSRNYKDSVKGQPMRAYTAYLNKKCRCDTCKLAMKLRAAECYAENPEGAAERQRKYRQTSAGKSKDRRYVLKRRSADVEFFETMTEEEHARFFAIGEFFHPTIETHVDHVVPVALGGTSHPDNLCVLTAHENEIKSDRHPGEWYYCTVPLAGRYRVDN